MRRFRSLYRLRKQKLSSCATFLRERTCLRRHLHRLLPPPTQLLAILRQRLLLNSEVLSVACTLLLMPRRPFLSSVLPMSRIRKGYKEKLVYRMEQVRPLLMFLRRFLLAHLMVRQAQPQALDCLMKLRSGAPRPLNSHANSDSPQAFLSQKF